MFIADANWFDILCSTGMQITQF